MSMIDVFNLTASFTSIILAILAIVLSIWFYNQSKNTETRVKESLAKIEAQADSLQRINTKWMDKLTSYITTDKPNPLEKSLPDLIKLFTGFAQPMDSNFSSDFSPDKESTDNREELISCYIALYFYVAQTNYWAQGYLPTPNEFDFKDNQHIATKRIIEVSWADFIYFKQLILKISKEDLEKSPLYHLFTEAEETLKMHVKSVSDIFIQQKK